MANHPDADKARHQIERHADEYTPRAVPTFRPPGPLKLPYIRHSPEQADAVRAKAGSAVAPFAEGIRAMGRHLAELQVHGLVDLDASLARMRHALTAQRPVRGLPAAVDEAVPAAAVADHAHISSP
jgi:hypothetical protein